MAHKSIAEALFAAQKEMPDLIKDSVNPHFKSTYISLHGLLDQVVPILQKHDILFIQLPSTADDGSPALTTSFIHGTDSLSATTPLALAQQSAQAQGGAITYMRRYALMAALALVAEDEDDDGNGSSRGASSGSRGRSSGTASQPSGADEDIGI